MPPTQVKPRVIAQDFGPFTFPGIISTDDVSVDGDVSIDGELSVDGDLSFVGAQKISTSIGHLTLDPGGSLYIQDGTIYIQDETSYVRLYLRPGMDGGADEINILFAQDETLKWDLGMYSTNEFRLIDYFAGANTVLLVEGNSHMTFTPKGNLVLNPDGTVEVTPNANFAAGIDVIGDVSVDGDLTFTGPQQILTTAGDLDLLPAGNITIPSDGKKLYFGADDDMSIYHDGAHAYSINTTGHMNLQTATGAFFLNVSADTTTALYLQSQRKAAWASPAIIYFRGYNDADQYVNYVTLNPIASDITDGAEDGRLYLQLMDNGAVRNTFIFGGGDTVAALTTYSNVQSGNVFVQYMYGKNDAADAEIYAYHYGYAFDDTEDSEDGVYGIGTMGAGALGPRVLFSLGVAAFQEATSIVTTAGTLTLNPATTLEVTPNANFAAGIDVIGDVGIDGDLEFVGGNTIYTSGNVLDLDPDAGSTANVWLEVNNRAQFGYETGAARIWASSGKAIKFYTNMALSLDFHSGGTPFEFQQATAITTTAGDLTLAPATGVVTIGDGSGDVAVGGVTAFGASNFLQMQNFGTYNKITLAGQIIVQSETGNVDFPAGIDVIGDVSVDGDLTFTGPQQILTTAGDLDLLPAGNITMLDGGGRFAGIGTATQAPSKPILTIEDDTSYGGAGTIGQVGIALKTAAVETGTYSTWFSYQFTPTSALTDLTLNMYMDPEAKTWYQYDPNKLGGAIYQQWIDNDRIRHQWYTYITGSFHLGAEYDVVPGGQTAFLINQTLGDCDFVVAGDNLNDLLYTKASADEIYFAGQTGLPGNESTRMGLQSKAPSDVGTNEFKAGGGIMVGDLEGGKPPLIMSQFKFSTPAAGPEAWGAYFGIFGLNAYYSPVNNGKWKLANPAYYGSIMDFYATNHATGSYIVFGFVTTDEGSVYDWITTYSGIEGGGPDPFVVINEDGLTMDFRVESAVDTHSLFVQGSDGFIGIGHPTPYYPFVLGDGAAGAYANPVFGIRSADDELGTIAFGDADSGAGRYAGWIEYSHVAGTLSMGAETEIRSYNAIKIAEIAAAVADSPGFGQLWVKNTDPCELWFTDDAGTDTKIV